MIQLEMSKNMINLSIIKLWQYHITYLMIMLTT
jgi:hypothetical protein